MTAIRVTGMSGMVPRRGARLLDDNQAQVAVNCRLTAGYVVPLKDTNFVHNPVRVGLQTIFKMKSTIGADIWLSWAKDVNAVKGPIASDLTYRTFYTGDNEPRVTDNALATAGAEPYPFSYFVLGVYPPANAPGVSHAGGAGAVIARAFCYTFVTPWGEESQPSPASAVTNGKVDGTWTVNGMDVAPLNSFAITNASWAAGEATLTMASTFGLRVGEEFSVAGMNPAGYNTTSSLITAVTPTTIKYAVASNPGAFVAGGTLTRKAPHNTTGMTKRIYWTETTVQGTAFQFVMEIAVATVSQNIPGNTLPGEVLPSEDWPMPPTNLKGLCLHSSGAMVGVSLNEICISEPNKPYAWPEAYRLTIDYNGIGCGTFGDSVLIATEGTPYTISGVEPATMVVEKIDQPWPCVAKRSIVSAGFGVLYAAPQGLVLVGAGTASIVTKDHYTQEEWQEIQPSSLIASQYAGRYVASYQGDGKRQVLIIDKSEFATVVQANKELSALWSDPQTGNLYVGVDDMIEQWDAADGVRLMHDWMSKEFVFAGLINLSAAKVDYTSTMSEAESAAAQAAYDAILALNQALITAGTSAGSVNGYQVNGLSLNGSLVQPLPPIAWDSLTFQLWIDGAIKFSKTITSKEPFRMPGGYIADNAAVRVSGNVTVKAITVAESMRELATA